VDTPTWYNWVWSII